MAPRGITATALYGSHDLLATEPLAGLGHAVTIAGVIRGRRAARGGVAYTSPDTAGAGGAPG